MPSAPHEPNTLQWVKGDVVLHRYDAKHPKMFMRVVGFTRRGLVVTEYVHPRPRRTQYTNPLASLLDPARFGLKGTEDPDEFERVRLRNFYHPVGTRVRTTSADGGFTTTTRSPAWLAGGNMALDGHVGGWWLKFVEVVRE